MGIGIGFLLLTSTTIVSRHFCKRRALTMVHTYGFLHLSDSYYKVNQGIVSSGSSLGGIVYSSNRNLLKWKKIIN